VQQWLRRNGAHQHRAASGGQKSQLRTKLRTKLAQLFDLRETEREREVSKLEEKLTTLRENLKLRKQNKDLIVENRLPPLILIIQ